MLVLCDLRPYLIGKFDDLRYGVGQARRGWLEKGDVLNTRPLAQLRVLLAGARGGAGS